MSLSEESDDEAFESADEDIDCHQLNCNKINEIETNLNKISINETNGNYY
jgi:hypothetical protein